MAEGESAYIENPKMWSRTDGNYFTCNRANKSLKLKTFVKMSFKEIELFTLKLKLIEY